MNADKPIRIYLADDHQIVIDGLKMLLANEPDIVIAGEADNGNKAWNDIKKIKPDIALIDFRMPGKDGLELVRMLAHQQPVHFIMLSMHASKRMVTDAINYGAKGYLLKNTGRDELLKAIRIVMEGKTYISEAVRETKMETPSVLTPREKEILLLVLEELTSQQISDKLSLSLYTVDTHRKNILRKTGAKTSAGLMKYALENNLLSSA